QRGRGHRARRTLSRRIAAHRPARGAADSWLRHGTVEARARRLPPAASAGRTDRGRAAGPGRRRRHGGGAEGITTLMALFPQQFIDDLRLAANIVQVVQEYVPLKRAGTTYKGLCPFHSEKTPSSHVNPDKGFFHCFGCGVG